MWGRQSVPRRDKYSQARMHGPTQGREAQARALHTQAHTVHQVHKGSHEQRILGITFSDQWIVRVWGRGGFLRSTTEGGRACRWPWRGKEKPTRGNWRVLQASKARGHPREGACKCITPHTRTSLDVSETWSAGGGDGGAGVGRCSARPAPCSVSGPGAGRERSVTKPRPNKRAPAHATRAHTCCFDRSQKARAGAGAPRVLVDCRAVLATGPRRRREKGRITPLMARR